MPEMLHIYVLWHTSFLFHTHYLHWFITCSLLRRHGSWLYLISYSPPFYLKLSINTGDVSYETDIGFDRFNLDVERQSIELVSFVKNN